MVKYASALSQESVVEVEAIVRKVDTKVEACTQSEVSTSDHAHGQCAGASPKARWILCCAMPELLLTKA